MKRLFWKFFIFISLAQMIGIAGVAATFWFKALGADSASQKVDTSPPAAFVVGAAAATLQYGSAGVLQDLIRQHESPRLRRSTLYVVDPHGRDLLGRAPPPAAVERARRLLREDAVAATVREVRAADGNTYLLFITHPEFREGGRRPPGRGLFPVKPVAATLLASILCALLLAWYFAKPIRSMRSAFEAVAQGRLDTRLARQIGHRRDELSDLGRHFDRMASRLQALVEGQTRLLHDVSHELRSPLARLQVAIGLARQQPDKVEAAMDRIEQEAVRIDRLVGQLLTLSRLEAGEMAGMDEEVDMAEILSTILDNASFEAAARDQRVALQGQCEASVRGKGELLYHALENVVRNALKYSPPGSEVVIRAQCPDAAGQLRIEVLDQGPGVPEAELDKIFGAFYRGSVNTGATGNGLGLAIAQQAIQAHGGRIRAANRPEGGLCVTVTLPPRAIET